MRINCFQENSIYHIEITGEITEADIQVLDKAILTAVAIADTQEVWLECTGLEVISAEALEYLTLCEHRLQEQQVSLVLVQVSYEILNLFQKVQLDVTLPVYSTKEEAYRSYRKRF